MSVGLVGTAPVSPAEFVARLGHHPVVVGSPIGTPGRPIAEPTVAPLEPFGSAMKPLRTEWLIGKRHLYFGPLPVAMQSWPPRRPPKRRIATVERPAAWHVPSVVAS